MNRGCCQKIDAALIPLRNGEYGYCLESGEQIGLPRLLLRPTAELSIDAKAAQEIRELGFRKGELKADVVRQRLWFMLNPGREAVANLLRFTCGLCL